MNSGPSSHLSPYPSNKRSNGSQNHNSNPHFNSNRGRGAWGRGQGRGGNGNPNSNKERPECKICHKVGHTAFLLALFARIDRGEAWGLDQPWLASLEPTCCQAIFRCTNRFLSDPKIRSPVIGSSISPRAWAGALWSRPSSAWGASLDWCRLRWGEELRKICCPHWLHFLLISMFEDRLRNKPSILGSTPPSDSSNSYRKKEEVLTLLEEHKLMDLDMNQLWELQLKIEDLCEHYLEEVPIFHRCIERISRLQKTLC